MSVNTGVETVRTRGTTVPGGVKIAPAGVKTAPTGLLDVPPGLDRARLEELVMEHLGKGMAPWIKPVVSFVTFGTLVYSFECHHMTG
jgi:hypothetical protein